MNNNEKLNIATKKKLGMTQVKNTSTINTENNTKITKILTAVVKLKIENVNVQNSQVKFDGDIEYDLLAVLEDGTIMPLNQKGNFNQTFEDSQINQNSIISIVDNLVEVNNVSNPSGDIIYSSIFDFDIYLINRNENISIAEKPENIFVKESTFNYSSFVDKIKYNATVSFDMEKDSKLNKILFINTFSSIKNIMSSNDYFSVEGELCSTIVCQSEDGQVKSIYKNTPFSEEIECKGATKESIIQARVKTRETTVIENNEKHIYSFETPIVILAEVYNINSTECVVDAYSLTNEVNLTTTSFEEDEFYSTKYQEDNIVSTFAIDDSISPIDKILSVVPTNISIVNQIVNDENLLLEGIASFNLIYYYEDEDSNNILNSLDVDIPYSLNLNVAELSNSDNVICKISICDVSVKNKHGKELEFVADIKVNYSIIKPSISATTTNITIGEVKPQPDYGLEIYLAKENQTLWDIAKELNISTSDLIKQNGELSLPLSNGEKIVVYHQRQTDFE